MTLIFILTLWIGRVHESWINSEKRALSPCLRNVWRVYSDYGFQQLTPTTKI